VAIILNFFRNRGVDFIDWLGGFACKEFTRPSKVHQADHEAVCEQPQVHEHLEPTRNHVKRLERCDSCKQYEQENKDDSRATPEKEQTKSGPREQNDREEPNVSASGCGIGTGSPNNIYSSRTTLVGTRIPKNAWYSDTARSKRKYAARRILNAPFDM